MIRPALSIIILLCWAFGSTAWGEPMLLVNPQKLKEFKDRIGYEQVVFSPDPDVGVVADWDGVKEFLPTQEAGWEAFSEDVYGLAGGLVMRKWSFRRGTATFILKVHVSSSGAQVARERFLSGVSTTSMAKIPYVRGPAWLGQLSVQMPGTPLQTVFWVFHNVFVELRDTSGISVEPMARSLQGFMERHVKKSVSQSLPRIDKVTVSKSMPHVDEEVVVQAHPKLSQPSQQLRVEFQAKPEELGLMKQSATAFTYQALRPGRSTVEASLSDLKFLLMSQAQVQVDIQPKK
ncbi:MULTISPECIES: hypothetical protein [Myxococcus]|uniref:hypothetical protein n=1 Tax=Myxococcus TaxID=32 RepID=UPI001127E30B|nr:MULTISPECIES: hypothetical protein [Myxococcus]QDE86152.1 hypothetical protein BHS07_34035 [Myxococcus xanthus]WAM25724.1 hypothetical protein OZ403_35230 [Myxococcus sp. NMCA1]